jgi:hypothetical protein
LAEWLTRCPAKAIPSGACVRITQASHLLLSFWKPFGPSSEAEIMIRYLGKDMYIPDDATAHQNVLLAPINRSYQSKHRYRIEISIHITQAPAIPVLQIKQPRCNTRFSGPSQSFPQYYVSIENSWNIILPCLLANPSSSMHGRGEYCPP